MMNNNYFLDLLYKKVMELKRVLEEIDGQDLSVEYKKYLISGYIITLDSILEIGISDIHTTELDELTSLIYYTRQKAVHYGYFNGMHNMEDIANSIINATESTYRKEQDFCKNLFAASNFELKCENIAVKNSPNITITSNLIRFKSKDKSKEVYIPTKKIFSLTKKSKEKATSYIIDLDEPISLYNIKDGVPVSYEELSPEQAKSFFKENFQVISENYNKHNETIHEIITKFLNDPINSTQIMEYASNDHFSRNTIEVIKDFILEKTMFDAYIDSYHLIKERYSLNKIQRTDYTKLQNSFKKNILQHMTQKDAFFVDTTIKRAKYYFDTLRDSTASFDVDLELLSPILIQLFETGPKYFSNQFINSSPEFKKCYGNLLRYRQIFSHYILDDEEYKTALTKFKDEFLSFIKILQMINLNDVRIAAPEKHDTYSTLEKDKSDFFNYKHEQYLRIKPHTYIGKKIYYSSKDPKSEKLIAIIPYGSNASNTLYYEKDAHDYLRPLYTLDEEHDTTKYIHVSKHALGKAKEVSFDANLSALFSAYSLLKRVKSNEDIKIYFCGSDENNFLAHHDLLESVILRYFILGYLPAELLTTIKIDNSKAYDGLVVLTDEKGNVIANITNKKKYSTNKDSIKDERNLFSRIDDINHNFSNRRHSK